MSGEVSGAFAASVSTTALAVIVAVAATLAAVALSWLAARLAGRSRPSSEERLSSLVRELDLRMQEMGRELAGALERAREESRRSRFLGELAGSIELDEVLRRTLEAAAAMRAVDAALLTVLDAAGEPLTAAIGLTETETEQLGFGRPPSGRRIRTMAIDYEPTLDLAVDKPPIAHGLAAPIQSDGETVGMLGVFSRDVAKVFGDEERRLLEDLATRAGPAVENARRFKEARQLADLDALTGLHNRRYFHETLAREVARARRYDRRLSLLVLDLDDFKEINDRVGHLAGDAVLAQVAERVREVVRSADFACRVGGDEFAIILPESTIEDAEQLFARLQSQIASRPIAHAGRLHLSAGIADLRPQDDAVAFFQRADDALYRAKEAGKDRVAAAATAIGPVQDDAVRSFRSGVHR